MAVVAPKPTLSQQHQMALAITVMTITGVLVAGVIGPIILAIVVGKIWGH